MKRPAPAPPGKSLPGAPGAPAGGDPLDIAVAVAARLADPATLARAIARMARDTAYPQINVWRPESLALGDAGLAVMCAVLDRHLPGQGWDAAGRRFLRAAAGRVPVVRALGLFAGATGTGVAMDALGGPDGGFLARLDARLALWTAGLAGRLARRPGTLREIDYDVVSGASGIAAYLLRRPRTPATDRALAELAGALAALCRLDTEGVPALARPAATLPPELRTAAPAGYVDCGMAHGYPGALVTLARIAHVLGLGATGAQPVLLSGGRWLISRYLEDASGGYWPRRVVLGGDGPARTRGMERPREGWCYGTPGVARALWLTGIVLDEAEFRSHALRAVVPSLARVRNAAVSPAMCHGLAGLATVAMLFAREAEDAALAAEAGLLSRRLVAGYDATSLLGYRDLENAGTRSDNPGLLNGAAGVVLALLALSRPGTPPWCDLLGAAL